MWSIITRDDGNYDVVPNSWIVSDKYCLYPNTGLGQIKKSAKNLESPKDDWEKVAIRIEKKDIDDFERGRKNVIRLTNGGKTLNSSEAEEKGRGKRKVFKRKMFFDGDDSGEELASNDDVENYQGSSSTKKLHISAAADEGSYISGSDSFSCGTPPFPTLLASFSLTNVQLPLREENAKCKLRNKNHTCAFHENEPSVVSNAHVLCHLSKSISSLHSNVAYIRELLDDISTNLETYGKCTSDSKTNQENEDVLGALEGFPITSSVCLLEMEDKLKGDKEFYTRCVKALASYAEKSSLSRTVRSILKRMVSREVASLFTWKGIKRKDHKHEKKAFKDLFLAKLLFGATAKCINEELDIAKIGTIAASWLAQAATKLEKSFSV